MRYEEGGSQIDPPEKSILKKPSFLGLKIFKNAFYFTSKSFLVLKMFKCLSWRLGHVEERLC